MALLPSPSAPASAAPAVAPATLRFPIGALERRENTGWDKSQALVVGSSFVLDTLDVPAGGFLQGVLLKVTTTLGAGAATFAADGPWSAIQDLVMMDPDGTPVLGPFSGYDVFVMNMLSGFHAFRDPVNQVGYTASTANGNFSFYLWLDNEIIGRDAIGALRNGASNSTLKVRITVAPPASIYSANPATTLPTVRFRAWSRLWIRPQQARSPKGAQYADRPFGDGAYQMWTKQQYAIVSGLNTIPLRRVGNFIREMVLIFRDGSNVRVTGLTADTPVRLLYEGSELFNDDSDTLRLILQDRTRLPVASIPTGVYLYDWCHEFDGEVGGELRDQWLPTLPGTRMELQFTTGASGSLQVLTNDVYVPADSPLLY